MEMFKAIGNFERRIEVCFILSQGKVNRVMSQTVECFCSPLNELNYQIKETINPEEFLKTNLANVSQ